MTRHDLIVRWHVCQQNKLCFVSMKPLEGNGAITLVYCAHLGEDVRVLSKYIK